MLHCPKINDTPTFGNRVKRDLAKNYSLYIMFLPILAFFIIFCYVPMSGLIMSFFDYVPRLGYAGSDFVGFKHFITFFTGPYSGQLIFNTFIINVVDLVIAFPAPIILAIMFFEIKGKKTRTAMQTISYMPYFISLVVVCGMIVQFSKTDGLFNNILAIFGIDRSNILYNPSNYIPIFVLSNVWQNVGFASIVFFAALCSVDIELFEAAKIDGAGKMKQIIYITIPSILPTIVVMFILRMGSMLNVGFEKVFLLQNSQNITISDVISTHVYSQGLLSQDYGYGTAVGLFNAVINLAFLIVTNALSKKSGNSLF